MSDDKSEETAKIVIDTNKLRIDAGKRLDSSKVNTKSGISVLNEDGNLGISKEFFTKGEKNTKKDKKDK